MGQSRHVSDDISAHRARPEQRLFRQPGPGQKETDVLRTFERGAHRLSVAAGTRVGMRYPANFDVLHVDSTLPLVAVADGMGGGQGSAVAGSTAMATFVDAVRAAGEDAGAPQLRDAVARAQHRVHAAGAELGELTGCTLTALLVDPSGTAGWITQIGDSRAYRLRGGLLELLTVDHTAAWLGAVYNWYPADSPTAAAARYQLTRYMGHPDLPEPDLLNVSLRPGDVYCLCTDGVSEPISYDRLRQLLDGDPADAVRIALADTLAAGGRDNATMTVVRVESIR
ncbi:protein phosphatase 2C domain-containing protein [Micromonospora sonneratiae]|uniref:PP2C family protein-serine/threonine phosphatase n=1 Tax=Micromonospora sonneratiae TaxID=1184706 RepID=A0ABW3YBN2_9ACTN